MPVSRLLGVLIAFLLIACNTQNDYNPVPNPTTGSCADTTAISYQQTIMPILAANCYRCHGTNSNSGSGGIILQDYNVLKRFAQTTQLNKTTGSLLYGNITHAGKPYYTNMPFDGGKLSDCDILKIKKWIDMGIPQN